jgi:hypothetical protein
MGAYAVQGCDASPQQEIQRWLAAKDWMGVRQAHPLVRRSRQQDLEALVDAKEV